MPIKKLIQLSLYTCILLLFTGCAPYLKPTQSEYEHANQICIDQVNQDQALHTRNWFSNWVKCKQERIMPIEISFYPSKQDEIHAMYRQLRLMAIDVDTGRSNVQKVYDEWDRMQKEIGIKKGVCAKFADGSQQCINPKQDRMFMQTKDGKIVPIK